MRMWRAALIVVCALAGGVTLRAQPAPPAVDVRGQRVIAIQVVVDGVPTTDPALGSLLDVVVGAPLDSGQVRSSIEHLVHLRRFATVDVLAEPVDTGVVVRVELTSAQRVADVRTEGALRPFADDIGVPSASASDQGCWRRPGRRRLRRSTTCSARGATCGRRSPRASRPPTGATPSRSSSAAIRGPAGRSGE